MAPSLIQVAAEISTVVMALVAILVLSWVIPVLFHWKKLLVTLRANVEPIADRARVAAENAEYLSAVVREDVQKIRASLSGLSERLLEASERMEERVEEFNALMDVVQDEAESVLLDTAAVVRGVKAGARTMGGGVISPPTVDPGVEDPGNGQGAGDPAAREAPEGR